MKVLITASRVRSVLDDARTEKDIELTLRAHHIRFSYDTDSGCTVFRIPARTGSVIVSRSAGRPGRFTVRSASAPAARSHYPTDYDM